MSDDRVQMKKGQEISQSKTQSLKVVISGIGTGGHFFPAVVVAQELLKRKVDVIFLVRKGYFEEEVATIYGLKTIAVKSAAFYGASLFRKFFSIFALIYSVCLIIPITKNVVGIAFGGFGALPLLISCVVNRSAFYLFEPNRIPGRATKLFASKAKRIFLGLGLSLPLKGNSVITGVPIRPQFRIHFMKNQKKKARDKKVLFLGGSQGARRLNKFALDIQRLLPQEYAIIILCGKRDFSWVNSRRNGRTRVVSFTFSPWDEMQDADVIVSRSGALAGYEILFSNTPTIFIPFPYAIDDHQYYNAEHFSQIGNAVVMRERSLTEKMLVKKIMELARINRKKSTISLDAEKRIVDIILKDNR